MSPQACAEVVFGDDYHTLDGTADYIHITDLVYGHIAAIACSNITVLRHSISARSSALELWRPSDGQVTGQSRILSRRVAMVTLPNVRSDQGQ